MAALAYQLPNDSRTRRAMDPTAAHGLEVQLLREIEHNQRVWHWANTNDAKDESTAPEPIALPGEDEAYRRSVEDAERKAEALASAFGLAI